MIRMMASKWSAAIWRWVEARVVGGTDFSLVGVVQDYHRRALGQDDDLV